MTLGPSLDGRRGWSLVIVIDDDLDAGFLVQSLLELQGYELILDEDGCEVSRRPSARDPARSSSTR